MSVLRLSELEQAIEKDRSAGARIAFANGCFDLLHVGHIRYLAGAAEQGDRLIVAINDDESVQALKGEGRPVMGVEDRAEIVAAIRGVDYVIIFSECTVGSLLERLKPDVHCKGTDYRPETVPENQIVSGYGGRTAIVGDPKQHSTRDLLARIASLPQQSS